MSKIYVQTKDGVVAVKGSGLKVKHVPESFVVTANVQHDENGKPLEEVIGKLAGVKTINKNNVIGDYEGDVIKTVDLSSVTTPKEKKPSKPREKIKKDEKCRDVSKKENNIKRKCLEEDNVVGIKTNINLEKISCERDEIHEDIEISKTQSSVLDNHIKIVSLVSGDNISSPNTEIVDVEWNNSTEEKEEKEMITLEELRKQLENPTLELTKEEDGLRRLETLKKITLAHYTFDVYNHARNINTTARKDSEYENTDFLIQSINKDAQWLLNNIGGYDLYVNRFGICTQLRGKEVIIVPVDIHNFNLSKLELDKDTANEQHGVRFAEKMRLIMIAEENDQFYAAMDTVTRGIKMTMNGVDSINELLDISVEHENNFYQWAPDGTVEKDTFKSVILSKSLYDIFLSSLQINNVKNYDDVVSERIKK